MGFVIEPFTLASELPPIVAAWRDAFSQPPSGPRTARELTDQLHWHGNFAGFLGFIARQPDSGAILGLAYGFSNVPGHWWRDRVAAALGPELTRSVLDNSFCLMELGVTRNARRQGIAAALVEELVTRQPHPRVLLSMQSDNLNALAFYRATGWSTLSARMSFGVGFLPYDILIRHVTKVGDSSPFTE